VIDFKRDVYRQALTELHRFLQSDRRHWHDKSKELPTSI